jgi:ribosomal protein S18 acetylase RimI-like enzyme
MPSMIATRTYLELTNPAAFRRKPAVDSDLKIERSADCTPALLRYLYAEVGRDYHWVDRLPWTDAQLQAYLDDPSVSVWLLTVGGTLAGYFELRVDNGAQESTEIAYFGLLPGFLGRGLGGHLLTEAVELAWARGARRVWLHTCSLDHPAALENYLKRGFTVFKREQYDVPERSPLDSHA